MSTMKDQLIRIGNTHPELRDELRPVIATLDREASGKPVLTPRSLPQPLFYLDPSEDPDDAEALFDFYRLLDRDTKGMGKRVSIRYDYAVIYEVWSKDPSEFLGALMVGEDGVYVYGHPALKNPKKFKHPLGTFEHPDEVYPLLEQGSKHLVKVIEMNQKKIRERQDAAMEIEHLKDAVKRWAKNRNDGRWYDDLEHTRHNTLEGSFRHPAIPKDTSYMDYGDIERYLDQDRQALEHALRSYKHLVKDYYLDLGDKNWVEFRVTLK